MAEQRTYWHLAHLDREPDEYDIGTSRLLYYPGRGFEVNVPFSAWHDRYVARSALVIRDGERFRDPRETTYSRYTALQQAKEEIVDRILESAADGRDERLPREWVGVIERALPPLLHALHGLQMIAAYVGHLAPSGRVVVTCALQVADEIRRVQRLAQRIGQFQQRDPSFGREGRRDWETGAAWQPLRRGIERLLVTYDWGEALTALNLCLKPALDALLAAELAARARASGDDVLAGVLAVLDGDCRWHLDWTSTFVRTAIDERPEHREAFQRWIAVWDPVTTSALDGLAPIFAQATDGSSFLRGSAEVCAVLRRHRSALGLDASFA